MKPKKEIMKALSDQRRSQGLKKVSLWMDEKEEILVRKYLDELRNKK